MQFLLLLLATLGGAEASESTTSAERWHVGASGERCGPLPPLRPCLQVWPRPATALWGSRRVRSMGFLSLL